MGRPSFDLRPSVTLAFALLTLSGVPSCSDCRPPNPSVGAPAGPDAATPHQSADAQAAMHGNLPSASDPDFPDAALAKLMQVASDEQTASQLQEWALGVLEQPVPAQGAETRALADVPEWIRQIDPANGSPLVVVRNEPGSVGPSVMLSWGKGAENMWGLVLAQAELEPRAPWFQFTQLRSGVFAFRFRHEGKPPSTNSLR
jgi:hypothetical protein